MMPKTKTPSDEKMIEALARKMGWKVRGGYAIIQHPDKGDGWSGETRLTLGAAHEFGFAPLTDLNAVRKVQEQLTNVEWHAYWLLMSTDHELKLFDNFKVGRHADARTCATALCRVIEPELFEGGGE